MPAVIRVATAIIVDVAGRLLVVRKRGTTTFMQPGGKIEPGESPLDALVRELGEEVGLAIDPAEARYLGRFIAVAANEPGRIVEAETYAVTPRAPVTAGSEIEELRWIDPADRGDTPLAPLILDWVLPTFDFTAAQARAAKHNPSPFVSSEVEKC